MTEIKLMNYGRGAGKTYTLTRWLEEDPERRLIVSRLLNGRYGVGLHKRNLLSYGSCLSVIKERAGQGGSTEIAFDDFDFADPEHLHILLVLSYLNGIKTVILATTHETMQTEADKREEPKVKFMPDGRLVVGGAISPDAIRVDHGYGESEGCEEVAEPIQSVKAKNLRIGDWVVGKGHVTSLEDSAPLAQSKFKVTLEDKQFGFRGTLLLPHDTLIDVDITKRK